MLLLRALIQLPVIFPVLIGGIFLYGGTVEGTPVVYDRSAYLGTTTATTSLIILPLIKSLIPEPPPFRATHLKTPEPLKGVYMTSCIASRPQLRSAMVKLIDTTELNAVVIDIKDYTGMISFDAEDPRFTLNTRGCFIPDIKEFIAELHKKNIYVIGRVTVMQDTVYPKAHPQAAVKRKSDGGIWKDNKGLTFIDPGATEYWDHMIDLGKASYAVGFDEINYDYIRFPSDGNMSDVHFTRTGSTTKPAMMKKFFTHLGKGMDDAGIPISADLFGMTTTNYDDLNIGQVLEDALSTFDYVAPMVYPSHYPPQFNGWKDPNLVPYEIIKFSMSSAVRRADKLEEKEFKKSISLVSTASSTASTTVPKFVSTGIYKNKLRPWLQDFDYGKVYTEADVRAQKRGTYDSGLSSWMAWDPSNIYTKSAYDAE